MLEHARILFIDEEIAILAYSFGQTIREQGYTCYGCAIMPDHVHVMMRRHRDRAEQIIGRLQLDSKRALIAAGRRAVNHPVWAGRGWKVFLNTREDMARVARYIALNPVKAGRAEQKWEFVEEYDGWMPAPNLR